MLQSELIENGERIHHWSDAGLKIRQVETGIVYDDAVDVIHGVIVTQCQKRMSRNLLVYSAVTINPLRYAP